MKATQCAIVFALALSEVACGGDTINGISFSSGLPKDTPLNSLSDAQLGQICGSLESYYARNASVTDNICRVLGVAEAGLVVSSDPPVDIQSARATCNSQMTSCRTSGTVGIG